MDAGKVEILESRTDLIPAGMRMVGFKDEDEFTRESYVKCTRYRLVILEDELGIRHEMYIPKDANDPRRPKVNVIDTVLLSFLLVWPWIVFSFICRFIEKPFA